MIEYVNYMVDISDEDIKDIIITAIEGGIGYWCCLDNTKDEFNSAPQDEAVSETAAKIILTDGVITLIDVKNGKHHYLDRYALMRGMSKYAELGMDEFGIFYRNKVDFYKFDAPTADKIVQLAIFGEIVYEN